MSMVELMKFFQNILVAIRRQVSIVLAISAYENNRQSTKSSLGSWEILLAPLQIMLFFIAVRVGFSLPPPVMLVVAVG